MEPKYSQIFDKNIIKSLKEFCELNKIKDIDEFIKKCFDLGFNIEKYGLLGKNGEIKEKIVEVPVEVIKEIIIEKEIPVEKVVEVIKEVKVDKIIEKEVYITDNDEINKLTDKIKELETELTKKVDELDIIKNNNNEKMLQETLQKLRKDLLDKNKKIEELQNINKDLQVLNTQKKGFYMRGSNLNDTLWHNY